MDAKINKIENVAVITIPGDQLDSSNTRDFKEQMGMVLDENKQVIFDLSSVRFIDSSGLGAILSFLRRLHDEGGDLKLVGLTKPVRMLFELVRMHRIFEIFNTADEAVSSFNAPQAQVVMAA
mgnify:FL=1